MDKINDIYASEKKDKEGMSINGTDYFKWQPICLRDAIAKSTLAKPVVIKSSSTRRPIREVIRDETHAALVCPLYPDVH